MTAQRRSRAVARLLVVLCMTAGCAAGQQQQQQPQQQQPQQPSAVFSTTPDELWLFIEQAVRAELQPLVSRLESRVDALDRRLGSRVDALDSRLLVLDSRVDALTFRLLVNSQSPQPDEVASRLDSQNQKSQLDALISKVDGQKSQLDGLIAQVNAQKSQLDKLVTEVDNHKSQVDVLVAKVDGQKSELDGLTGRLGSQESLVTGLATKLGSQQSQLAVLTATSSSHQSQLDGVTNQTAGQETRIDVLTATSSSHQSQLDGVTNQTAGQGTQIDVLTASLDPVESEDGPGDIVPLPRDCSDLPSGAKSGIHLLQLGLDRSESPVPAFCDLDKDGGNWTVIQRRTDIKPRQDFFRDWAAYREGFGELEAEFWWGLGHLWTLTSARDRQYELHVSLEDFEGETRHALYQGFRVSSEADGYRLTLGGYTGDAGDSLEYHVNRKFSTRDRDQDGGSANTAHKYKGGWWYGSGYFSNLNGRYQTNPAEKMDGIAWHHWMGVTYSLKEVEMKIRPRARSY